jgi:hypothetical protein
MMFAFVPPVYFLCEFPVTGSAACLRRSPLSARPGVADISLKVKLSPVNPISRARTCESGPDTLGSRNLIGGPCRAEKRMTLTREPEPGNAGGGNGMSRKARRNPSSRPPAGVDVIWMQRHAMHWKP